MQTRTRSTRSSAVATARRRRQRVVGFELDHRPHRDAERLRPSSSSGNCAKQLRRHAAARLVAGPQVVAERLDHVVGGDADVGRALLEHPQHRAEHATDRRDLHAVGVEVRRHAEVVAEELVGAVDEVHLHRRPSWRTYSR